MLKDGKYKLRKDGQEYDAVITTLYVYDGIYSKSSAVQFVCIPNHFPIPLDSWLLEDFVMMPVETVEHRLHPVVDVFEWCGCEGYTPTMENGKCSECGKNAHS